MRKSYRIRPRAYDELYSVVDGENYIAPVIYEQEYSPTPTGVLDSSGEMIYSYFEADPIGFYPLKERL